MEIGSESAKIKSQKLEWMSFRENFTPRNFLAIRYLAYNHNNIQKWKSVFASRTRLASSC